MRSAVPVLLLVFSVACGSAADAAKRVALVIGNNTYATLPELHNARKDATDMAAKLKGLGFDVILKTNAGRRDMHRAIGEFSGRLDAGDTGLVFYAGHGIQSDGNNYLIPSDAQVEIEDDLQSEAITANRFVSAMNTAGVGLSMMILDACRDNPLPKRKRSATRGLAVVRVSPGASGSAILYSAGPGQTAEDGDRGANGVFTEALLEVLGRPSLNLGQVFKETAKLVALQTNNRQKPWMNNSFTGDFYFNGRVSTASQTKNSMPPPSSSIVSDQKVEMMFWQSIKDSARSKDYEAYLAQFPHGVFAGLALNRISEYKPQGTALTNRPVPAQTPELTLGVEVMRATMIATGAVNVRSKPSTASRRLLMLSPGEEVTVTGKTRARGEVWYQVHIVGSGSAFVFGELLKDKPDESKVTAEFVKGFRAYQKRDYPEAVSFYRKAAEQNHGRSQFNLGFMYERGLGLDKNYAKAIHWYRKAAAQGIAAAYIGLGGVFESGAGGIKNYAEAVRWYRKAAKKGNSFGKYKLGGMYDFGLGVDKNYVKAADWYRKAADEGLGIAQSSLGLLYEKGRGVSKDYAKAINLYRKAAIQGDKIGQTSLGYMYEFGLGVNKNYIQAVQWYRKAADQGDAVAQQALGGAYEFGRGVGKDYDEAVRWYKKSARQGNNQSINWLKKKGLM
jgi:uncharacterized protein